MCLKIRLLGFNFKFLIIVFHLPKNIQNNEIREFLRKLYQVWKWRCFNFILGGFLINDFLGKDK